MKQYIRELKIGNLELNNNLMLAPMAGITDMPFRIVCRQMGSCGLMFTEMVSAKGLHYQDQKSFELTGITALERPIGIQLFGSDPQIISSMIDKLNQTKADLFDINMGCPMPKITKNGEGSALMLNPKLAYNVMSAAVKTAAKPVTVKIRKGWDEQNINAVDFAKMMEDAGAAMITVHGRTREQMYGGKADWEIIRKVKEAVHIPVIGNGDVVCAQSARDLFDVTNCDGLMIGRGAQGNPWIFSEIEAGLNSGQLTDSVSVDRCWSKPEIQEKKAIMCKHLTLAVDIKGERSGILEMRKHLAWYVKGLYQAASVKNCIFQQTTKEGLLECIQNISESRA